MLSFWVSYPGVNKKKDAHHTVTLPNTLNQSGESPSNGLLGDDLPCEITGVPITEGPSIACTSTFYTDGAPTSSYK